ncbi:hypothetical protein Taro_054587 [Colocasia esculenta]|uniref:Uncharacterized protein n=1 Tax=Colocasia esculenta TaxID=4460 RepID=A0A843XQH6_COLES|nr:hypothetical protein [Colocasia esculenta]
MVTTPRSVATCSLSRRADPSRLGAHRFKIEAGAPFSPSPLSLFFFFLLLPPPSSLFSGGETSQQLQGARRAEETGW